MTRGVTTKIRLAYSPVCNFDFTFLKEEEIMQHYLKDSMLYIIAQRPVVVFNNINYDEINCSLKFELTIVGTQNTLRCTLPLYQPLIEPDNTKPVITEFGSYDKTWTTSTLPLSNVNGIKFYNNTKEFKLWLSPDKFLFHYFHGDIKAEIVGKMEPFICFFIHYVGKATDQDIWKRLTGHSSLQDILSIEYPLNYGSLPTHEIILLLFEVQDFMTMDTLEPDATPEQTEIFVARLLGEDFPNSKDISLDAEKLLIKLLNPEYNEKKFPNYPVSKDGLYRFSFEKIVYHFADNLIFKYKTDQINCMIDEQKSDLILIEGNKQIEIVRHGGTTSN